MGRLKALEGGIVLPGPGNDEKQDRDPFGNHHNSERRGLTVRRPEPDFAILQFTEADAVADLLFPRLLFKTALAFEAGRARRSFPPGRSLRAGPSLAH